ncbi:MAG: right-handed parallel beta-helix repeat-containing protein [Candidatus Gracilibacteria bacterium]|nr:right-handed parallel beta-helix repeat-containing protein [Candidatus Gracilibacteria bacterium]
MSVGTTYSRSTWTPGIDWIAIHIYGAGSTNSILDYTQVKHAGGHIYPYLYTGIYIKDSSPTVRNSLITLNYHGIGIGGNSSPTIFNSIIYKNSSYGINNSSSGAPNISYNLYYNNGTDSNISIDSNSITGQDPLFVDEIDYELQAGSPAINAGFGTSPDSGDTFDIGVREIGFGAPTF